MSPEETKVMFFRYVEEVINKGDLSILEEFIAPEYTFYDYSQPTPEIGIEARRQHLENSQRSNFHITIEDCIVTEDRIVTRGTFRVIRKGQPVEMSVINIFRLNSEGKQVEEWAMWMPKVAALVA